MSGPLAKLSGLVSSPAACVTVYVTGTPTVLVAPTTTGLPLLTFMSEKVTSSVAVADTPSAAALNAALPDGASAACAAGTAKAERTRAPETAATVVRMRMLRSPGGEVMWSLLAPGVRSVRPGAGCTDGNGF